MSSSVLSTPSESNLRRWFLLALLGVLLFVGIQYTVKASEERSAFIRWRNQLHALGEGKDIYRAYVYPNAPMMALILYPLSLMASVAGALCWFALKVGMTFLAFVWTVRIVQEEERPFPLWGQVFAVLLSLRPIIGDLSHGNVNLLILFLVIAALYAFKRGWDLTAGLVLALGITCKVTPALFVVYFIWKRAWKTVAASIVGLGIFFIVIPGAFLGFEHNWKLLNSWVDKMILPYTIRGEVTTEHCNQSLPGLIYRLGTHSPSFLDEDEQPADYHNLAELHPDTARWIVKGCGFAFLGLLFFVSPRSSGERGRGEGTNRDNWRLAAEYSIVILGMLLFSERTWKHHCVTMLLPFSVLCYYFTTHRLSTGWRAYIIGTIAVAVLLMTSTSTSVWDRLGYRMGAKMTQVYGAYVWAELVLVAALVFILRKERTSRADEPYNDAAAAWHEPHGDASRNGRHETHPHHRRHPWTRAGDGAEVY